MSWNIPYLLIFIPFSFPRLSISLSLSLARSVTHTHTLSLSLSICLAIIRKKEDGRVSRSKSSSVRLPRGLLCVHSAPNCLLFPNSIKMGEFSDSLRERDSSCIISRVKESGGGKNVRSPREPILRFSNGRRIRSGTGPNVITPPSYARICCS